MYLCICKAISQNEYEKALDEKACPFKACKDLGVGSDCGRCVDSVVKKYCQEKKQTDNNKEN